MSPRQETDLGENNTGAKSIEIDCDYDTWTIVFLIDGRHFMSGGEEGMIRCWRVEDGEEVGTPMDAGSVVGNLAASPDGKYIVSGTITGQVAVWDVETHRNVHEFKAHSTWVRVVDVSPDATRIATGSKDRTVCVWSLSGGNIILGPLEHDFSVGAVKFSPDGCLLATATWWRHSVRVYNSQNGDLLNDFQIQVDSALNQSITWASDSKRLFTLSVDGYIRCIHALDRTLLSQGRIHNDKQARCIALSGNGALVAASADSTFSFWSTATFQQLGPLIEHAPVIVSMAISADYIIVTGGGKRMNVWNIYDLIPATNYQGTLPDRPIRRPGIQRTNADGSSIDEDIYEKNADLEKNVKDLRAREEISNDKIMQLEQTVQKLRSELTDSQRQVYSLSQLLHAHEHKHQCEALFAEGHIINAATSLFQMTNTVDEEAMSNELIMSWFLDFQQRCKGRLEELTNTAMDAQDYDEAIKHLSAMLLLNTADRVNVFIRRSKLRASMNLWAEALNDADKVIKFDPSSHQGYEMRHTIFHSMKCFVEATEAFHTMLSKLEESPDEHIRKLRNLYIDVTPNIRRIVGQTTRGMPRILIDTTTGRLYDRAQQAAAFEELPIYSELVSSMTKQLDHAWIYKEVRSFYRYVMLSHKWELDEPLLQKVMSISVYALESSLENIKLQTFCSFVRDLGFRWAWSDTVCVDKLNNVVLQESLVAMFTWYRGSALTIVYLRGVSSKSQRPGGLRRSVWNTRGWTYQEYVASETVQFYTEDWKPYLGLTVFNHKSSPDIISEMQQATGVSAQQMAILRPGLNRVRDKLFLASRRQTTLVEDAAYSLFGIFNVGVPVIYGEGNRAIGRLLEHILTGSGDVTILAWTGTAGGYNSCLPTDLTVYDPLMPPHIPAPIEMAEMDARVAALRGMPDLSVAVQLYNHLNSLPSPSLASSRLRLPCVAFHLTDLVSALDPDPLTGERVYRSETAMLGEIEIKTTDDLTGVTDLCLVHPWIRPLLDQEFAGGANGLDRTTQALRLVVRLRQPFGGLLFAPVSRVEHKRVATDALIIVRFREEGELTELIEGIRTIEVQ